MIRKDNLKFANLWNKINVKIASKLKKTPNVEVVKQSSYEEIHSKGPARKIIQPHGMWDFTAGH